MTKALAILVLVVAILLVGGLDFLSPSMDPATSPYALLVRDKECTELAETDLEYAVCEAIFDMAYRASYVYHSAQYELTR